MKAIIENWLVEYIFWELKLLSLVGYTLEFEKIAKTEFFNNVERLGGI